MATSLTTHLQSSTRNRVYSEAEVRAWLAWLARNLQRHSQTVFLIEQLQPSWLETRTFCFFYILASRIMAGLTLGLLPAGLAALPVLETSVSRAVFTFVSVSVLSVIASGTVGFLHAVRLLSSRRVEQRKRFAYIRILLYSVFLAVLVAGVIIAASILFLAVFRPEQNVEDFHTAIMMAGTWWGMAYGLIFGFRDSRRLLTDDIRTAEVLGWSWKKAMLGFLRWGAVPFLFALGLVLLGILVEGFASMEVKEYIFALSFVLIIALPASVWNGITSSVSNLKCKPNEGIRRSIRNAFIFATAVAISILATPIMLLCVHGTADITLVALTCLGSLAFALFIMLLRAGLDVIQHYVLRVTLRVERGIPFRLAEFLDYAVNELRFLQKVGGGYIFIHRILLDHFADMEPGKVLHSLPNPLEHLHETRARG